MRTVTGMDDHDDLEDPDQSPLHQWDESEAGQVGEFNEPFGDFPVAVSSAYARQMLRTGLLIGVVVAAILAPIALVVSSYTTRTTTEVVVFDKERVCESGGGACRYLVFTDDTTYRIGDSVLAGRFSSSDAYGQIRSCHRYELVHYGWRIGLLSMYPNIVSFDDLGPVDGCDP